MELVFIITGLNGLLFLRILIMPLSLRTAGFICNRCFYWCLLLSYICELPVVFVSERNTWDLCLISLSGSPVGRFLFSVLTNDIYTTYYTYYKYCFIL